MRSALAALLLLIASSSAGAQECGAPARLLAVGAGVDLPATVTPGAWLRVREWGDKLAIEGAPVGRFTLGTPLRYGEHWIALDRGGVLRIVPAAQASGAIEAQVDVVCDVDEAEWRKRASRIDAELQRYLTAEETDALLAAVEALGAGQTEVRRLALVAHLRAQTLLLGGRSDAAVAAFDAAGAAWRTAADARRSMVAELALTEELMRIGKHEDALARAALGGSTTSDDYFAVRLALARCLALRNLGRMPEALACFEPATARMQALGETLDAVSAMQDLADVARFLGRNDRAQALGHEALRLATSPGMEVHRGRIALMLADMAGEAGDIAGQLEWLDRALLEFQRARATRWEANALIEGADLYIELSAWDEAADLLAAAQRRLSESDAPARVAAAGLRQARIEVGNQEPAKAQATVAKSIATFERLGMAADLDGARLLKARVALLQGDVAIAVDVLAGRDPAQTLNAPEWLLLAAEISATAGDCAAAQRHLQTLGGTLLPLSGEVRRVEVEARCLSWHGDEKAAEERLWQQAVRIARVAGSVRNPLLREMLLPRVGELRRTAFALKRSDPTPEDAWRWLQVEQLAARSGAVARATATREFDAQVARAWLDEVAATPDAAARRSEALLAVMGGVAEGPVQDSPRALLSLADLQRRLGADAIFLSEVAHGDGARLLWISRNAAGFALSEGSASWRAAARELSARAARADTPIAALEASAAALSRRALGDGLPAQPRRLLIDAGSDLARLPWTLLTWPAQSAPLGRDTDLVLARIDTATAPRAGPSDVTVFLASDPAQVGTAPLANTASEPALIARALDGAGRSARVAESAGRERLLEAIAQRRPWVHVASHGSAAPTRLGYAGLWFDDNGANVPRFVSWLEILQRGAAAEVVVLNACNLGDPSSRWMSFADAVNRAGARDVVAAQWRISDGAAAVWVPAFYRAVAQGADIATAVSQARRALRESRAYRHPFHWATLVHIGRI